MHVLLWDAESRSWGALIEPLSSTGKRILSLDAIELCFTSFRPSFEGSFAPETVGFAREALALLRQRIQEDSLGVPEGEFFDNLYALQERDHSPGTASIVMAISEYADSMSRSLSASDVLAIMSACYEAVLNSERIPRVTAEAERGNENCVRLIAAQRTLIDSAANA
ncbi:hypothetical protein [Streptomyces olivochromogenes]|uniref:hypothetical protein n=1 Tax=Streptomyces olivochromogenes TaxID=1963 RepID=UPI001F408CEB|nr:hypothetical protein [Streptomyces olivochromogenes]MCF3135570.1 hypothetical protein [Streptomyces olivochromogenes]